MLYFTILRQSKRMAYCPTDCEGWCGEESAQMDIQFFNTEVIVASRNGVTRLFHVREIRRESEATISGWCVEGEDQL